MHYIFPLIYFFSLGKSKALVFHYFIVWELLVLFLVDS